MLGQAMPMRSDDGAILKWFGTCTDIHDLVVARQEAKRTREQLLRVIDHAKVTVWAVNSSRVLTLLEGSLMWDQDLDARRTHIGHDVYRFLGQHNDAEALEIFRSNIEDTLSGKSKDATVEMHVDKKNRWFRTRFMPLYMDAEVGSEKAREGTIESVIAVSMDVTGERLFLNARPYFVICFQFSLFFPDLRLYFWITCCSRAFAFGWQGAVLTVSQNCATESKNCGSKRKKTRSSSPKQSRPRKPAG